MTKIQQMIDAGIPVIESQSNENAGSFAFSSMTDEQQDKLKLIFGGWDYIKGLRNQLLGECDWTQLPDAVLTLEEKSAWSDYRQALRDIPQDYATPDDVVFPTPPHEVQ